MSALVSGNNMFIQHFVTPLKMFVAQYAVVFYELKKIFYWQDKVVITDCLNTHTHTHTHRKAYFL